MKVARYWEQRPDGRIACLLCPQHCVLKEGQTGFCRAREVVNGELQSLIYERVASAGLDPIEKKPLYHFYPGSQIYSVGSWGCNFRCGFCQNWSTSQSESVTKRVPAEELARHAKAYDSIGVAFTYNEPTIWIEYILDSAPVLKAQGSKVVLVTNGYINPQPLEDLLPHVDAMNIDLKAPNNEFYRTICKGRLQPVLDTIAAAAKQCWVEITHLVVSGEEHPEQNIRDVIDIVASISPHIPLHFSRYYPQYHFEAPSTPEPLLRWAYETAKEKLTYVYLGNISLPETSDTFCPACHHSLIKRRGNMVQVEGLAGNRCEHCGSTVDIIR